MKSKYAIISSTTLCAILLTACSGVKKDSPVDKLIDKEVIHQNLSWDKDSVK